MGLGLTRILDYVKAGSQIYTFSFDTLREPVWGDFYAKGSNTTYAYNTGFGTNPGVNTTDFNSWIQVPDTKTAMIPLPGNVLLLGSGLVGLGLLGWRRRKTS